MTVESTKHMFFYCRSVWLVWNKCYAWLGITSIDHVDPTAHFLHFNLLNAPAQVKGVWNCVWVAVVSELWKHKNKHIFQGGVIHLSSSIIKHIMEYQIIQCFCIHKEKQTLYK